MNARTVVSLWFRKPQLLSAACLLLTACPADRSARGPSFRVRVHCQTQEGRATANVLITGPAGSVRTDGQGNATLEFAGPEGEEVSFKVEKLPPGLELADRRPLRRVVLKSYAGNSKNGISDLQHDILLRNRKDPYVVLVYADRAADLPVIANGGAVARLNSSGAAAFRHEGKPGEQLSVTIVTKNNPRASAVDPNQTFQLPDTSRVLLWHSDLTIASGALPSKPKPKPKPAAPKMKVIKM